MRRPDCFLQYTSTSRQCHILAMLPVLQDVAITACFVIEQAIVHSVVCHCFLYHTVLHTGLKNPCSLSCVLNPVFWDYETVFTTFKYLKKKKKILEIISL